MDSYHSLLWCHVLLSLTECCFVLSVIVLCVCTEFVIYVCTCLCGCSGRSVCHQYWTVQLLSRVLWTSLAAITSALVQWTAIIHCSGPVWLSLTECCFVLSVIVLCVCAEFVIYVCTCLWVLWQKCLPSVFDCPAALTGALDQFGCHHKCSSTVDSYHHCAGVMCYYRFVLFCLRSCCVCVQNLSCMYVLACGCSGRSVCHQCWTVQLLSRVLWTSLAAITSALVQWTAIITALVSCATIVLFCFVCDRVVCVYRICHLCMYLPLWVLWQKCLPSVLDCPAALTGALDQFGCHHKCSSTVDSYHSLLWCHVLLSLTECCFVLSVIVLCVCTEFVIYVCTCLCGCSGRSVCHQYWTVQLLSRVLWTSLAAITSALVQWTAIIHCSGPVWLSLTECCFVLSVIVLCVCAEFVIYVCTCLWVLWQKCLPSVLDCPAALTGALDQFGCHHKCSSTVDSYHSLLWCHVLLSLTECCFVLSVIVLCVCTEFVMYVCTCLWVLW